MRDYKQSTNPSQYHAGISTCHPSLCSWGRRTQKSIPARNIRRARTEPNSQNSQHLHSSHCWDLAPLLV